MFIGVDGIIVHRKDACGLTPAVSKVSSGAIEFQLLYQVKFMKPFLEEAVSSRYNFKVISTNVDEDGKGVDPTLSSSAAREPKQNDDELEEEDHENMSSYGETKKTPLTSLKDLNISKEDNILLILGSEGQGVSRTIEKFATHRVIIPP